MITVVLLASVHPALVLLLLVRGPGRSSRRPGGRASSGGSRRRCIANTRLARHLFVLGTTAAPGKEVRVTGTASWLRRRTATRRGSAGTAGRRACGPPPRLWHSVVWALFGVGYVGRGRRSSPPGSIGASADVLLVLAAGSRLSAYIGATVGEIGFLRGIWIDASRRLAWLEDYAAARDSHRRCTGAAIGCVDGIRLEHVSFAYPGTDRLVLDDVDLRPAGRRGGGGRGRERRRQDHAGEAAGQDVRADGRARSSSTASTSPRSPPSSGASAWPVRSRTSSASSSPHSRRSGVGDLPRLDERPAAETAVGRAGADDVVERLAHGLDTQLGPTWAGGRR